MVHVAEELGRLNGGLIVEADVLRIELSLLVLEDVRAEALEEGALVVLLQEREAKAILAAGGQLLRSGDQLVPRLGWVGHHVLVVDEGDRFDEDRQRRQLALDGGGLQGDRNVIFLVLNRVLGDLGRDALDSELADPVVGDRAEDVRPLAGGGRERHLVAEIRIGDAHDLDWGADRLGVRVGQRLEAGELRVVRVGAGPEQEPIDFRSLRVLGRPSRAGATAQGSERGDGESERRRPAKNRPPVCLPAQQPTENRRGPLLRRHCPTFLLAPRGAARRARRSGCAHRRG